MKLKIMHKLLILVSLPIITLILFSLTHIDSKYSGLMQYKMNASKLHLMKQSSNLLHELQIERGASLSYMHNIKKTYFTPLLSKQKNETDKAIKHFLLLIQRINTKHTSTSTKEYIKSLKSSLEKLTNIRMSVYDPQVNIKEVFKYYTHVNQQLLTLFNSFKISSSSKQTSAQIASFYRLLKLQEYAGQERALVAKLSNSDLISPKDIQTYHILLSSQEDESNAIHFLLENYKSNSSLDKIDATYEDNGFAKVRKKILNHETKKLLLSKILRTIGFGGMMHDIYKYQRNQEEVLYTKFLQKRKLFNSMILKYIALSHKKTSEYNAAKELQNIFNNISKKEVINLDDTHILKLFNFLEQEHITLDSVKWFKVSTQRINAIHKVENVLFSSILQSINTKVKKNQDLLRNQIFMTLTTIFFLLFGTYFIANKIKHSILKLKQGIDDFFSYLDARTDSAKLIDTDSNDELNDMAQSINLQIQTIKENLEKDKDFINETTQIVMLMKEGNFSEKPYFEPHSPNLIELNNVFKQLTELISDKIKEQTDSLEELNSSLEERVHFQTLELEKQIKEITISMDKAIAAEIAKDEFLANMSHEIRTPLNAILGFVTILKKQTKEEKSLKYLNIIDSSGKSLLTIINDILDFSKIQSGKFIINPYIIDPVQEMSNASLLFASKAYEKHLIYDVYIDVNMPQAISVDAVRVTQIFSNLLSNAIKFTHYGQSIKVKVSIEDSMLILSIEDTGIGIAEKNMSKIFTAFEQADGSTTRKYGGTGLGLSISYKLAKLMKGNLRVMSEEGVGSTFELKVPIEIIKQEPLKKINPSQIAQYTIAILDDYENSIKLRLIKKYLLDFGVVNIIELDAFQSDGYDLLFFIPDDVYNEEIIDNKVPSIAILRNSSIKIADFSHIQALYTPLTPSSIVQSILASEIMTLSSPKILQVEDEEELQVQFRGNILVAEDNKTNQMLISLILDDYGLEYKIAKNGLEAVSMFKKEKFDLILMDENMPELNGIGAMQQIKEYEKSKELILTPIIALTASVLDTDKKMFLDAGMDGFVGKPIENNELESELGRFLNIKE